MSSEFNSPALTEQPASLADPAVAPSPAPFDEAPHPFRFGLQALMLLMACCGVQFSLMSYLGILPGLLVGLAVCFVVLGGMMVWAMITWRGAGTPALHRLDQLAIRLVLAIVLLGVGSVIAGGGMAVYEQVAAWRRVARIQRELGFTGRSQLVVEKNQVKRGLVIDAISLGGPLDLAGGQPGDVILLATDLPQFYNMLEENRGREINLTVAAGAELQPVDNCAQRQLSVTVPR